MCRKLRARQSTRSLSRGVSENETSLVHVDLTWFTSPGRRLGRTSTIHLTTFVSGFPVRLAPVVEAPFLCDSHSQIPQGDFGAIPATCFVKNSLQVMLDLFFCDVGLSGDFGIGLPLKNQRGDGPLSAGEICVSEQQRHLLGPHFQLVQSCHLYGGFAIYLKPKQSAERQSPSAVPNTDVNTLVQPVAEFRRPKNRMCRPSAAAAPTSRQPFAECEKYPHRRALRRSGRRTRLPQSSAG